MTETEAAADASVKLRAVKAELEAAGVTVPELIELAEMQRALVQLGSIQVASLRFAPPPAAAEAEPEEPAP